MSNGECYICLEENAPPCLCDCNSHVHDECLLRACLCKVSSQCTVCKKYVQRVKVEVSSRSEMTPSGNIRILCLILFIFTFFGCVSEVGMYLFYPEPLILALALAFSFPCSLFLRFTIHTFRSHWGEPFYADSTTQVRAVLVDTAPSIIVVI